MKKLFAVLLSIGMIFTLSACVLGPNVRLNSTQSLGEVQYKVPSKWESVQSSNGNYYYISDDSLDGFLYVSCKVIPGMETCDISDKDVAYSIIDNVIIGLVNTTTNYESVEEVQSKINNETYYTLLDYKTTLNGYDCEVICVIFLSETSVYQMSFVQENEISNENKETFYNIFDTIKFED